MIGFVNILKPSGLTSSDVVVRVRRIMSTACGEKLKVGHLGTLDPAGAGVLPIAIGKATRLFDELIYKQKKYRTTITFGKTTDTLDSMGVIIAESDVYPTYEQLLEVLPRFVGKLSQIPPQYSAISVGGKRAYDLARQGIEVEISAREIEVYDITLVKVLSDKSYMLDISCSGGTYIRSLVRDIAAKLGAVAYMSSIIRLASGVFEISDSVTLDELERNPYGYIIEPEFALQNYARYELDDKQWELLNNGIKQKFDDLPKENFKVFHHDTLLGIWDNQEGYLSLRIRLV